MAEETDCGRSSTGSQTQENSSRRERERETKVWPWFIYTVNRGEGGP